MKSITRNIFEDFIGLQVKCPYRDGDQFKIAKGILTGADRGFVKIKGSLGTIIINESNIEKMTQLKIRRNFC